MNFKLDSLLERLLNECSSITLLLNRLFKLMLITLGLITALSAIKEVNREVKTCLDERINAVFYTLSDKIEELQDKDYSKLHSTLEGYKIGKYGTTAIVKIVDDKVTIDAMGSSGFSIDKIEAILNQNDGNLDYIRSTEMPELFLKPNFKEEALSFYDDFMMYKMRFSSTVFEDVYILSIVGPDESLWKILRIFVNAIFLTVIVVPITLIITRRVFTILSKQIDGLGNIIKKLTENNEFSFEEEKISSNNEIGSLAMDVERLTKKLEAQSYVDDLTLMSNKRKLYKYLNELTDNIKNGNSEQIAALFLDIDYFKKYNDNYGHVQGDEVLRRVGRMLNEVCKDNDVFGFRFGGEEFIIIADKYSVKKSITLAKCIQEKLKEENLEHKYSEVSNLITLSIGIYCTTKENLDIKDMVTQADKLLYEAKKQGRNRYLIMKKSKNYQTIQKDL